MRVFTPLEMQLLTRIRDGLGSNLYNLIDPWIAGVSFQVNTVTNDVDFIFEQNPGHNVFQRLVEIQSVVIQAVNLIKLFEDKGFIFTFISANVPFPNPFIFGQAAINLPAIPYRFPDPRISSLFCDYSIKEIFVTPELNRFITDGFISREEFRARRQWRTTCYALGVAIIALVFNLFFNVKGIFFNQDKMPSLPDRKSAQHKVSPDSYVKTDTSLLNDTIILLKSTTIIKSVRTDTIRK